MPVSETRDPAHTWLDHVRPTGLVVAPAVLDELGLAPQPQAQVDSLAVEALVTPLPVRGEAATPALADHWAFFRTILGWDARYVAGAPGGPAVPDDLVVRLANEDVTLAPDWVVLTRAEPPAPQILVTFLPAGIEPDRRGALPGWEASAHHRLERLLSETKTEIGLLVGDDVVRLVHKPAQETAGWLDFPIRALATVAGRPMLGGLKLMLGRARLFTDAPNKRLPALLAQSREAQANVSTALAEQVLGALHELLRGLDAAEPDLVRRLAVERPGHLYEGLLAVLMRCVFVLYAEDRDLLPSLTDRRARALYERSYSLRGLYAKLVEDAALNPDTMDDRRGAYGGLLALFRMIHGGHPSGFLKARGGKLFDPNAFPFLEGRADETEAPRVPHVSDACVLRVLEGLMTLETKGRGRERLSYRTLDVEQIGSVYETVMGFTVAPASAAALAIKAGKNNRTPVYVDCDELLAAKAGDRGKVLKEAGRGSLPGRVEAALKDAKTRADIAAALDPIVDERASPGKQLRPPGAPILQPTDERRRTGSHYTPRSLTEPIVRHALEPAFERIGADATPEDVLALKVCDPAMGSGAFLVEACRQLGARLVEAWRRHGVTPALPPDEDEDLHARRLVAQRCLYGVDKNPRAVDLARLSLWLATLARDHEFTFLDHALKEGDSLVGLSARQIKAANWDETKPGLPLFRDLIEARVGDALAGREEIRTAPDDVARAIQEVRHRTVEERLDLVRLIGDATIAAFFAETKPKAREKARVAVEEALGAAQPDWDKLRRMQAELLAGDKGVRPFHWEVEFPEVFARENPGFDAVVGNPPFLGGTKFTAAYGEIFADWLKEMFSVQNRRADLVAYFLLKSFDMIKSSGICGLIATNTVAQGDTQEAGLRKITSSGGTIIRALRRLVWPGDAAVIVSVIHFGRLDFTINPVLDGKEVRRISAWLNSGVLDGLPHRLNGNRGIIFRGHEIGGRGFLFVDGGDKGRSHDFDQLSQIEANFPNEMKAIFPYLGGEEVNTHPTHLHRRYVIDFGTRSEDDAQAEFPQLMSMLFEKVHGEREKLKDRGSWSASRAKNWWQFAQRADAMDRALSACERALVICRVSPHMAFTFVSKEQIFSVDLRIAAFDGFPKFCVLQSRVHELWARFFSSTMEDRLRYSPSDCFATFPFASEQASRDYLERAGREYFKHRAQAMIDRNEGLTKTYNRFHDRNETGADIVRLRELHAAMDRAVLEAYGWRDLAEAAAPEFIEQEADEGKTPKTRLDWPAPFKDTLLARLLDLNAERAAQERALGVVAEADEGEEEGDEGE